MMENGEASRTTRTKTVETKVIHSPISQSRQIIINRSSPGSKTMTSSSGFRESYRRTMTLAPGSSSAMATTEVNSILQGRTKEKKDMQELNQRFGTYIEKVRFLEAQNRKLATELTSLRDRWCSETEKIKAMYEGELKQLRRLLDESERNKAELEVRINSMEDRMSELNIQLNEAHEQEKVDRQTIDKLNKMMTEYESEINILRKRVSRFDDERARDRKEMDRLRSEVNRLRNDLDNETLAHINAENDCQTAREELEFLKQVHEAELKELSNLAYRDTTAENRDYWKQELAQALHDIQDEYDNKLDIMKNELEANYSLKVSEIRTTNSRSNMEINHIKEENVRIKTQLSSLRDRLPELEARNKQLEAQIAELLRELEELKRDHELERNQLNDDLSNTREELAQVLEELQHLLDAKLSLELEIVAYRKLLEGEEARSDKKRYGDRTNLVLPPKPKPKPSVEKAVEEMVVATSEMGVKSSPMDGKAARIEISTGEMSAKTSFQRTAKGNVSIKECSGDGSHVVLENTSTRKKQDISSWTLKREIDNGRQVITFKLPANSILESDGTRKTLVIWAKGMRPKGNITDLECNDSNWGIGSSQVITTLTNEKGEERATHTSKTTYHSSGGHAH